jgi:hypothetical protein
MKCVLDLVTYGGLSPEWSRKPASRGGREEAGAPMRKRLGLTTAHSDFVS